MKKSDFDILLERYLAGRTTAAENQKIEAWLDSRKTKEERNAVWTADEEELLFQKITSSIQRPALVLIPDQKTKPNWFRTALGIAAGVVILITSWWIVAGLLSHSRNSVFDNSGSVTYATLGERKKVILKDKSIVWLNPGSTLVYEGTDEKGFRRASLTGEGIFEVTKDPLHPFQIRCGTVIVNVLGTSFHLKSSAKEFALEVLTGKVSVFSETNQNGITAEPREKIRLATGRVLKRETFRQEDIMTMLSPTEYLMDFENAALGEVFSRIENKFDVKLTVPDSAILTCRITADFTDRSLERTFQMLAEILDLNYKINGSTVAIEGAGCQP